MIYLTGDTHGNFERIAHFCARMKTQPTDIMIILGEVLIWISLALTVISLVDYVAKNVDVLKEQK